MDKLFNNTKGFSMIEIVIFIVVFSIGVIGMMTLFSNVLDKSSDPTIRLRSIQVIQATMDEILAKKWDEATNNGGGTVLVPTPVSSLGSEGSETFDDFDDIDDYNGMDCVSGTVGCFDVSDGFTIRVVVSYGRLNSGVINDVSLISDYKIIQVGVQSPMTGDQLRIIAVKGNF